MKTDDEPLVLEEPQPSRKRTLVFTTGDIRAHDLVTPAHLRALGWVPRKELDWDEAAIAADVCCSASPLEAKLEKVRELCEKTDRAIVKFGECAETYVLVKDVLKILDG